MNIELISPKLHERYSPNLYQWLNDKYSNWKYACDVYVSPEGRLFIGIINNGDFLGCNLMAVLCNGSKERIGSYIEGKKFKKVKNFWKEYQRIGRCAIDKKHVEYFINDNNRWKYSKLGKTRHCQWCGNCTQTEKVRKVVTFESRWVNKRK